MSPLSTIAPVCSDVGAVATSSARCAFCSTSSTVVPCAVDLADDVEDLPAPASAPGPSTARRGAGSAGCAISARPMASICCSPPDRVPPTCCALLQAREEVEDALHVARDGRLVAAQEGAHLQVLGTVRRAKMRRPSGDWAMPRATISCAGSCVISSPSSVTRPGAGR